MSPMITEHARARLITDGPDPRPVPVILRYDASADPRQVRVAFPGGTEWTIGRDLLERGLRSPVRQGAVLVWPCGRAQLVVERHAADGVQVFQFDVAPLIRFLHRTHEETGARPTATLTGAAGGG